MEGIIQRVNDERGFGFIRIDGDPKSDHFFHFRDLSNLPFGPELVGQRVKFDGVVGPKGLAARNVEGINQ